MEFRVRSSGFRVRVKWITDNAFHDNVKLGAKIIKRTYQTHYPLSVIHFSFFELIMKGFIYQAHIWLGIFVAIPVLLWSFSGFLYALPDTVEGNKYEAIDQAKVKIGSSEAIEKAIDFAGTELPVSSLTLQMKNGVVEYQAISGVQSISINAETGEVVKTPPPTLATRFFREAHFYFFLYPYNTVFTAVFSLLACLSVISGIYLNVMYWRGRIVNRD